MKASLRSAVIWVVPKTVTDKVGMNLERRLMIFSSLSEAGSLDILGLLLYFYLSPSEDLTHRRTAQPAGNSYCSSTGA